MKNKDESHKQLFAKRFREVSKGYTNERLAEMFDCGIKAVEKWKNESPISGTYPQTEKLFDICDRLGCDMNYLFMEDSTSFSNDYETASKVTGLSNQALKSISNLQNDIREDINGLPQQAIFKKNLLDYLLVKYPDFIGQFLELIFTMLENDIYFHSKENRLNVESLSSSRKNQILSSYKDKTDLQIVRITRLLQSLMDTYDKDTFYEDIGALAYENDRRERVEKIQKLFNDNPSLSLYDTPKDLIPYSKFKNEPPKTQKGGKK